MQNKFITCSKNKYAILILAAGSSERLGRPKQLVKWNKTTLLNHTIAQTVKIKYADTFLALGGNQNVIRPSISRDIPIIDNPNWREGMGNTISNSLRHIEIEKYEAIILSVCDQPFISTDIFTKLIEEYKKGDFTIVISNYENSSGPPTLFAKKHYPDLLILSGDQGANKIVKKHSSELASIGFPNGHIDIDTKKDIKNLTDCDSLNQIFYNNS